MRVILIDECAVFREGLKTILQGTGEVKIVAEADSFREVFERIDHDCDVVVIDGRLDALALLRALDKTHRRGRPPYVLIMADQRNDRHALQMFAAGTDGYLTKSKPPQSIVEAIRKISRGMKYISPEQAELLFLDFDGSRPPRLSNREYEVLCLMASGLGATDIAGSLSLSVKTISTYRSRLLEKLHLKSNAELIRYAVKEGIMP
jgi:two-component system, NarL family, invasion response regulator UvrY